MPEWTNWNLGEMGEQNVQAALIVLMAIGLLYCFMGYRLFKFVLCLTGFLVAGTVALALVGWLSQGNLPVMAVGALIGGICGGMALFWLYRVGVFFIGLLGLVTISYNVLQGRPESWVPWAIVGAGLAGGLLALAIERPVMTLATASIGAWLIVYVAAFLMLETGFEELAADFDITNRDYWWLLGGWAALTLVGTSFQLFVSRKKKEE